MSDNLDATNIDAVDSSAKPMSGTEYKLLRDKQEQEKQAEQERKRAEHEAKVQAAAEQKRITDALRDVEERERAEVLRRIRTEQLSTEAGRLQRREVMEISEEKMLEARTPIRVAIATQAGVLGHGEAGVMSEGYEGTALPQSGRSEGSFLNTEDSEDFADRAEPMSMGISLADLNKKFAAQEASVVTKPPEAPVSAKPPVSERAKRAAGIRENPLKDADDSDIDNIIGNIGKNSAN